MKFSTTKNKNKIPKQDKKLYSQSRYSFLLIEFDAIKKREFNYMLNTQKRKRIKQTDQSRQTSYAKYLSFL